MVTKEGIQEVQVHNLITNSKIMEVVVDQLLQVILHLRAGQQIRHNLIHSSIPQLNPSTNLKHSKMQ